jgi:arginyl-tRNA synthetase
MSGRKGRYITLDEVLEESQRRAFDEISLRNPSLPASEETRLAREIGIGAVIFALISVESGKKVTFVWERVLDFEQNSAPFIQYAHVRARNILEKSQETKWEHDAKLLTDPLEKSLILKLSRFPDVFLEAAETLRPRLISEYANSLAKEFNSFYASIPVIRSSPEELRSTRLCLVDSTRIVLANSLSLLGISLPSIM